jgi:hypothetical protein
MSTLVSTIIRSGGTAGALVYQGVWNANTNTPAIVNGVGNKGQYYKVSVNGTTNIDGISTWYAGDIIAFNGTTWDKIDGIPDEVLAVNGQTGNVSITNITGNAATASMATTQLYSDSSTKIATTAFVHDVVANDTGHLSLAGGTMLGALTLASNPVSALQAVTKQYADSLSNPGQLLASDGYQKLSGGLIIQWGHVGPVSNNSTGTITLPIAYPTAHFICIGGQNPGAINGSVDNTFQVFNKTLSAFEYYSNDSGGVTGSMSFDWFSIGH